MYYLKVLFDNHSEGLAWLLIVKVFVFKGFVQMGIKIMIYNIIMQRINNKLNTHNYFIWLYLLRFINSFTFKFDPQEFHNRGYQIQASFHRYDQQIRSNDSTNHTYIRVRNIMYRNQFPLFRNGRVTKSGDRNIILLIRIFINL